MRSTRAGSHSRPHRLMLEDPLGRGAGILKRNVDGPVTILVVVLDLERQTHALARILDAALPQNATEHKHVLAAVIGYDEAETARLDPFFEDASDAIAHAAAT